MVLLPLLEAAGRKFLGVGIPGGAAWVQHLTLWVGMFGAVLASFRDRHLSVAAGVLAGSSRWKGLMDAVGRGGCVGILACLVYASVLLVVSERQSPDAIAGWMPVWLAQVALPVSFVLMAVGTVLRGSGGWRGRTVLLGVAVVSGPLLALLPLPGGLAPAVVGLSAIVVLAAAGMPIYAVLGGSALLLFFLADVPVAAVPAETYRIVTQPVLPSIPLFALAGVVFARGGAPKRLLRLVDAWTRWMPGGALVATIGACACFTALTGASGVTILALGGLLLPVLIGSRHGERFSLGLLTASGSVGLLFPPSLPVILYGVYGAVPIDRLFLAALVPGLLLLVALAAFGIVSSKSQAPERGRFDAREALAATWGARGDLALPVLVVAGLFGGIMTLVELSALAALWAILLEVALHRSLPLKDGLVHAFTETSVLIGVLLAIVGLALGFVSFLVDAQIPLHVADWATAAIGSKLLFLLALNLTLLVAGMLMDIYSAIVVLVPLMVPAAVAFGIEPTHLGIIFLANLELGYLTPPVGMNLFLSSLTFDRPLWEIWRAALPFAGILAIWVLTLTYAPALSVGVVSLFGW